MAILGMVSVSSHVFIALILCLIFFIVVLWLHPSWPAFRRKGGVFLSICVMAQQVFRPCQNFLRTMFCPRGKKVLHSGGVILGLGHKFSKIWVYTLFFILHRLSIPMWVFPVLVSRL